MTSRTEAMLRERLVEHMTASADAVGECGRILARLRYAMRAAHDLSAEPAVRRILSEALAPAEQTTEAEAR